MTTRTCTVSAHTRTLRSALDTPINRLLAQEVEEQISRMLVAELERVLPANDGYGGHDPRNLGMI